MSVPSPGRLWPATYVTLLQLYCLKGFKHAVAVVERVAFVGKRRGPARYGAFEKELIMNLHDCAIMRLVCQGLWSKKPVSVLPLQSVADSIKIVREHATLSRIVISVSPFSYSRRQYGQLHDKSHSTFCCAYLNKHVAV